MCFSAGASFAASATLGLLGVATITKARSAHEVPFASIPLLFAVQQGAEGALWIALSGSQYESWQNLSIYLFLIFAQLIWPTWIPLSVLMVEKHRTRRKIIKGILGLGIAVSLYVLYGMIFYNVDAEIHSGHIAYKLDFPFAFSWIGSAFYFIPTTIPLFISSNKRMWVLATATVISFIIAKIFFEQHLISVWCFFAAVLSILVLWIVWGLHKPAQPESKAA
jgi:hypothetical protein